MSGHSLDIMVSKAARCLHGEMHADTLLMANARNHIEGFS
jgi:hypothetical protein